MNVSRFFGITNREAMRQVRLALGPDALIVIYSDHGEEFWEHDILEGKGHVTSVFVLANTVTLVLDTFLI